MNEEHVAYRQPNSNQCFVCGMKNAFGLQLTFYDNGHDQVWTEYTIPEYLQGYPGVTHGGVIAAMLHVPHSRILLNNCEFFWCHMMNQSTCQYKSRINDLCFIKM